MSRLGSLLVLLMFVSLAVSAPVRFWVSTSGSDANDGDEGHPFATLGRAQLAMREALNSSLLSEDAIVTVLPGTYVQPAPLVFEASDSGQGGWRVIWNATGASLFVGVTLTGWAPDSSRPGVWVTNVTGQFRPPAPAPPLSPPGCGLVEPGWSYNGFDIVEVLVPPNNVSACCAACAAQPGCAFWSLCVNITCGTPGHPINCYLKTSNAGRTFFGPLRTSGSLPGSAPAPPEPSWRFYSLVEGRRAGIIARLPNAGSGYLGTLNVSNSDSALTWAAGSPYFPPEPFDVSNAQVFCNLGADWFSETRTVTGLSYSGAGRTLSFEPSHNGVAGCNNKAYLQGPVEFLDEPGEFALLPATGLLSYWPHDPASLAPGSTTPVVAATSPTAIEFRGAGFASDSLLVHDIVILGLEVVGSDFTPDGSYSIFPPGRPNDTPPPTNTGMIRIENATRISIEGCRLLHAGLSAVWVAGWSQNVTVDGCWIEGPGFCGVATAGPYPGDPPYESAAAAYVNRGLTVSGSLIYDVGKRVGHGAGVWLFQTGSSSITNNYIKEAPRNGVGMYGIRFGAGGGFGSGVLPASLYGQTLDFWSALDVLTTRDNVVAYNQVENVVRDSCDAGAFETWGVGAGNTFHTNSVSDCDSGGVDGSWMNFLFQDDASHYMNHSSNIVFHCAGRGSEEAGMIKSVGSVLENNVIAHCLLGHLFNLQPYIEPAAGMTFARNLFAFLSTDDDAGMDISINAYTSATLAGSSSLMTNPATAAPYNFTNASTPALSDPVVAQLDWNLYYEAVHNASSLAALGWDTHALAGVNPLFVEPPTTADWNRTAADLALQPGSPAYSIPGFRAIDVAAIGLPPTFPWASEMASGWARRGAGGAKVQAETYDRQMGLWREGSYGISPGPDGWAFAPGAWASYARTDLTNATVWQLRITPLSSSRNVSLAVGGPTVAVATFCAACVGAPAGDMATYNVSLAGGPLSVAGGLLFLVPDGECIIDWFRLL